MGEEQHPRPADSCNMGPELPPFSLSFGQRSGRETRSGTLGSLVPCSFGLSASAPQGLAVRGVPGTALRLISRKEYALALISGASRLIS